MTVWPPTEPRGLITYNLSKNGGEPVMLDHGQAGWVRFISVDETQVYFTDIANVYSLAK